MDYIGRLKEAKQKHNDEFALLENLYKRGDIELTAFMNMMSYSDDKYMAEANLLRCLKYANVNTEQK